LLTTFIDKGLITKLTSVSRSDGGDEDGEL
jgi:hypothetical protein